MLVPDILASGLLGNLEKHYYSRWLRGHLENTSQVPSAAILLLSPDPDAFEKGSHALNVLCHHDDRHGLYGFFGCRLREARATPAGPWA